MDRSSLSRGRLALLSTALCLISLPTLGSVVETGVLYTVEQRGDGEKDTFAWEKSGSQLQMSPINNDPGNDMAFSFIPEGNGLYRIRSKNNTKVLDVNGGIIGAEVSFETDDGSDDQLWYVQNLAGYVRFISKSTGLAVSYDDDNNNSADYTDSVAVLADPASGSRTEWVLRRWWVSPQKSIGVNQNGWAPAQTKIAVLTRDSGGAAPAFSVSGPQTLSGTMTHWGGKWELNFYQADLSSLTAVGHYTITSDGISQDFSIVADPFRNVRAERGGVVDWQDIVDGILEAQRVKAPGDYLREAVGHEGTPSYLSTWYTLDGGYYDASSVDNKIYRTARIFHSLAIAYMETTNVTKRSQIIGTLRHGVDWLDRTQQPDGSWDLGKVRVSGDNYYWSTDKDPAGVSQVVMAMAATADALSTDDPAYSTNALALAESGWDWVTANSSSDSDFIEPIHNKPYFGSQNTLIGAAIELYRSTGSAEYKTYADSHILEAEYSTSSGKYEKRTGTPWPGTIRKRGWDIGLYLSRYHPVAQASVRTAIGTQLDDLTTYYVDRVSQTPWGISENHGAPRVNQGWFRGSGSYAHTLIEVARVLGTQKALDAAMAEWDAITGSNPWGSNCFVGGRGEGKIPLWHQPWKDLTGAVVPGPMTKTVVGVSTNLTHEGAGYQHTEQVVYLSVPVIPFWAIANKLFPPLSGNQTPEFYAASFDKMDAVTNINYQASLAGNSFDSDGDALTFSKAGGPGWLNVGADGALSGTPLSSDLGLNSFNVEVSDGGHTSAAVVNIDVTVGASIPPVEYYTLTLYATNGAVSRNPDLAEYAGRSTVELLATPDPGFVFAGWSGDASGAINPLTVTMDAAKSVTASFVSVEGPVGPARGELDYRDPMVPAGLQAGDTFHLVFVTSPANSIDSTWGLAQLNAHVNDIANDGGVYSGSLVASLGLTWYAIASDTATDARDNAVVSAPVYRVDGALVATGFSDLWDGSIATNINITEKNTIQSGVVRTGSASDGTAGANPFGVAGGSIDRGLSSASDATWNQGGSEGDGVRRNAYALSQRIKVVAVTTNHFVSYAWLASQNATWTNDYEAAVTNDADGDGFTTAEEYWSGTDPMDGSSFLEIGGIELSSTNFRLVWAHSNVHSGIPEIAIQGRASLQTGSWEYVSGHSPSNGVNFRDVPGQPGGFYRLCVLDMP